MEKLGAPSAVPLNPNSRLGRKARPLAQGRVKRDALVVGIDVSKDRLDMAIRPGGEVFSVSRDTAGLDGLIAHLAPSTPLAVAVEATGGFETVVAASLAAANLPVVVGSPAGADHTSINRSPLTNKTVASPGAGEGAHAT